MSSCDCDRKHIRHEHHHDYCLCHCTCRCHSEERENRCSCACHDGGHGGEGHGGGPEPGGDGGTTVGWKNPGRPGHTCGTSTGQVPGGVLQPGNFGHTPPNRWPGPRDQLFLPFLFMRANPGDLAARPVVGPFWESPDILLLAGVEPAFAPAVPPDLGQTALAEQPNTLYAHVWNFGLAQAPNVVVEFYWCDPSLGIGPASANLIGEAMVSLGARGSGQSHALVKCPAAWTPTFVNGGHECLVVRTWDETSDGLGTPPWDAALNRHVAQRNIHVIAASNTMHMAAALAGGASLLPVLLAPLTLKIGPLYGEPAQIAVVRAAPHEMPWLQLRTGVRGQFPAQAAPTGRALLTAPRPIGGGVAISGAAAQHEVTMDNQQVSFSTGDTPPGPGEAHVYRVTASQQGQVFGGYTVVLLG